MSNKIKLIISLIIFILISIPIYLKFIDKNKTEFYIQLNGKKIITIYTNQKYQEPGYKAKDSKDGDLTNKVKINGKINNKPGTYELIYSVTNSKNEKAIAHRFIKVITPPTFEYKESYDKIDNKVRGWWSNNKKNHKRPSGGADINELKKYNAYFIGPNKKVIYLTFDEGSNDTYLKKIVDVLDKNNVKATFFLCHKYIENNPELIKKMDQNGHTIANHTVNHLSMPTLANKKNFDKFIKEIQIVEETFYKITGHPIEKIYRDPRGEWSYRSLQIMKDLGYKSFFYSADYYDFDSTSTKEKALNELSKRVHNGAIYLIHPKNKGNYLALNTFINNMKKQGYTFDLVKNIS